VAGTADVDVEIALQVARRLQHRGQVHDMGNAAAAHEFSQVARSNIKHLQRKAQAFTLADIGADDLEIVGQAVAQLVADVAGCADDQDALAHAGSAGVAAAASGGGRRAQNCDRVMPAIRCHTPQKPAISSMPPASGKKVNRMTSARPEFWMPTSMVTARRSAAGRRKAPAMPSPRQKASRLWPTTSHANVWNFARKVSKFMASAIPAKASSTSREKMRSGFSLLAASPGQRRPVSMPSTSGAPSTSITSIRMLAG